jgi:hypothetical protein
MLQGLYAWTRQLRLASLANPLSESQHGSNPKRTNWLALFLAAIVFAGVAHADQLIILS